jgi:hypothetical protein
MLSYNTYQIGDKIFQFHLIVFIDSLNMYMTVYNDSQRSESRENEINMLQNILFGHIN